MLKIRNSVGMQIVLALLVCNTFASTFTFEGRLSNLGAKEFKINRIGIFNDIFETIPTDRNGDFYYQSKLLGNETLYIILGENIYTIYIEPGDHVKLVFNVKGYQLISLSGSTPRDTRRYNFDFIYNRDMMLRVTEMFNSLSDQKLAPRFILGAFQNNLDVYSKKLSKKNKLLGSRASKYYTDLYFIHLMLLKNMDSTDYKKLRFNKLDRANVLSKMTKPYEVTSNEMLQNSDIYRTYILDKLLIRDSTDNYLYIKFSGETKRAAPWIDFRKSIQIKDQFLRDWYLMTTSVRNIKNYDFTEASSVLDSSLKEIKDIRFKTILCGFKDQVNARLLNNVPEVKMFDLEGEEYHLSNFRGKVLYITFWTTSCIPCLNEFQINRPSFIEKYSKNPDMLAINVCLDGNDSQMKRIIEKYDIQGLNVSAKFEEASPTFQIYSFPRYMIVDKNGKVQDYSAGSSKDYLKVNSRIDQLLRE